MTDHVKCFVSAADYAAHFHGKPTLALVPKSEPEVCIYCSCRPVEDPRYAPYCGPECSISAEND